MSEKRNTIAIFLASLFSYQIYMAAGLMASMQLWFSHLSGDTVIAMFTMPTLAQALSALIISPIIGRYSRRLFVILGLLSISLGGVLIVMGGGASFAIALCGAILCGIGYSLTLAATNTMLVEMYPESASTKVAANCAVGCLGSMFLTTMSGILARDGVWMRAYILCFPAAIGLILFLLLYRETDRHAVKADESAEKTRGFAGSKLLFACVILVLTLMSFNVASWNTNYSIYVMNEKAIGGTVQTGLMNTLASLGGVIGGFFAAGLLIPRLKWLMVPVSLLFVALPGVAAALGCESISVFYICSLLFMMFYQPAYAVLSEKAGKLLPGAGVSFITAAAGLGSFVSPYLVNLLARGAGGRIETKFAITAAFAIIAALVALPSMKKLESAE